MNAHAKESTKSKCAMARVVSLGAIALALVSPIVPSTTAADFKDGLVDWQFESGLDKVAFSEAFKRHANAGYRISDIETYRAGRSLSVTTVWTKLSDDEKWQIEMSMPVTEFIKADEKHRQNGYSLVELEVDRLGATLHFSGIWMQRQKGWETELYFGMESLEFSNRYGEMADRGYRLIDFEAYEANGKYRHAGVWMKNEGDEVRFYRAIPKNRFSEVAAQMAAAGFRLLDVEGYQFENDFVFAGQWVSLADGQQAEYAFDLLADEFYNRNGNLVKDGYRLTEFEVYEDNKSVYYAGSWLKTTAKGAATVKQPVKEEKKSMSLEAFRSSE